MINQMEDLLKDDAHKQANESPACDEDCCSTSNRPVRNLSPSRQKEVHSLLQETANTLEVNHVSMDMSLSSIQLLHSIIREACRKFGFSDSSWQKQLALASGTNLYADKGAVVKGAGEVEQTVSNSNHTPTGTERHPVFTNLSQEASLFKNLTSPYRTCI